MNHTKEPWWKECGTDIVTQDGKFIATTHQPESMVGTELEYENARRIVACVNACAGIETDALERLHELYPMLFQEWLNTPDPVHDMVVEQRDSLLAAAKNLRDVKGRFHTEQAMKQFIDIVNQIEEQME